MTDCALLPASHSERESLPVSRVSIGRASAFAAGTNVVQLLGGFFAAAMLARLLGPAQKGAYDLYAATSMLLSVLLSFSLNAGVTYAVASQPVHTGRLMRALAIIAAGEAGMALAVVHFAGALGSARSIVPPELGGWGAPAIAGTVPHSERIRAICGPNA